MHIVIVGNGITGITAARFVRKASHHRITVVSDESDHFYARTALMYIYMGDLRFEDTKPYADDFWLKSGINLARGRAIRIDADDHLLHLASGERIQYDRLLLATGSRPNRFGWPNEYADGVQGLYGLDDLARMEDSTRSIDRAVVVGGGLIGVEMAEMLSARGIEVDFVVREAHYMDYLLSDDEAGLVEEAIRSHHVRLHLAAELDRIQVNGSGRASGVILKDGRELPAEFVGLAVGVHPNADLARESGLDVGRGILVDETFGTSATDVFAAGDCAEFRNPLPGRKAIEQLWYTGRSHGRQVASCLVGEIAPYSPPLFFNSAKFFDLEYQTYGQIGPRPEEGQEGKFFTDGRRSLRILFRAGDRAVVGVNGMGIRLRQNVWSHWIRTGTAVEAVIGELKRGEFDPEFTKRMDIRAEVAA